MEKLSKEASAVSAAPPVQFWQSWGNVAQLCSAAFSLFTLVVATGGFILAYGQLKEIHEGSAKRLFGDYLRVAVDKPHFAEPRSSYDKIRADPVTLSGYKAFVWSMLYACEEILTTFPNQEWRTTCSNHLGRHVRYLCEFEVKQLNSYDKEMRELMTNVMKTWKGNPQTPECE